MKGTIVKCFEELVVTQFGQDKWEQSLEDAGLHATTLILPVADIDDNTVMKIVRAVCKNLNLSLEQAADAFGSYWIGVYSQNLYPHYFEKSATARDFLLNIDHIHVAMTKALPNSRPPRFNYTWKDDKTLVIRYRSHRGMLAFAVGLVKGVAKFYHERLDITTSGTDEIVVAFP